MKIFYYWNNKTQWHGELLAEIWAENITKADKLFETETNLNPSKNAWIGCSISKQIIKY